MSFAAVIAARGGSLRVKNKNIRPFAGSSLLERKVNQLKEIGLLDHVYVNSESREILSVAEKCGAIPVARDPVFSTNTVQINEVYKHVVSPVPEDNIVFIHITSPFVSAQSIEDCISLFKQNCMGENAMYDSLATVTKIQKFIWNNGKPVNYNPSEMPRSQDLPDYYCLNFAVNILPKKLILEKKNIIGDSFYPYYLDEFESMDIDTMEEFELAEKIAKSLKCN